MKCNKCEKPATFHFTERVGEEEQWEEMHLCEQCARDYLSHTEEEEPDASLAGALAQHLQIGQTAEELARLDERCCPVCGITFREFRQHGRLGCPHDYVCFEEELEPLIMNIHGDAVHTGKQPVNCSKDVDKQTRLIRLRREMREAVHTEDYERASELRDEIKRLEGDDS